MDRDVLNAIAKWPNVPAVYGWLSLDCRGRWKIHPDGASAAGGPGESIGNTQILAFISRNYTDDGRGGWYFQNGPQRVYVRLDGAPFVIQVAENGRDLQAHTGAAIHAITAWWLDDTGRLFAQTEHGPGIILDRDLQTVLAQMSDGTDTPMIDTLSVLRKGARIDVRHPACPKGAPLMAVKRNEIPPLLHFNAAPSKPN